MTYILQINATTEDGQIGSTVYMRRIEVSDISALTRIIDDGLNKIPKPRKRRSDASKTKGQITP